MANKMAALAKDTAIYGLSSIVGRFLNYLLTPLYTNVLKSSTGEYAVITKMYAWTALLLVLLTFGMETTMFRFANKENTNARRVMSTALIAVSFVSIIFVALCYISDNSIAAMLGYPNHADYVRIMSMVVALDAFQAILFSWLRFQGRAIKFASLKLLNIFMNIGLNLLVVLVLPKLCMSHPAMTGWFDPQNLVGYIFIVNLICTATVTFGFIPEIRVLREGFDWPLMKQMLSYSWPLLLLGLAGILNQVADKICYTFIVKGHQGEVELGLYGGAVKVAMIMTMLTMAFRYAYEPMVFSAAKKSVAATSGNGQTGAGKPSAATGASPEQLKFYADGMKFFVIFALLAYLAVIFYMDIIKYVVGNTYWEALKVVPIVMMAEIFMGIYFNLSFWYKLTDQTWWGAVFSVIGCAVLLAINFIFVPKYGYMACAWGGFAGYGVCMLLSYFTGQKRYPIDYPIKEILAYFLTAGILYACYRLMQGTEWWAGLSLVPRLAIGTVLICIYAALVYVRDIKGKFSLKLR